MKVLFTSEAVSMGHPDKVADQISDAILDLYLEKDPKAHVACETLVTKQTVVLAGEVNSVAIITTAMIEDTVRKVITRIGYTLPGIGFSAADCAVINMLHTQSPDINQGVNRESEQEQGAGDQGMMFGYACAETPDYMPLPLWLSHSLMKALEEERKQPMNCIQLGFNSGTYLCPDAKAQVTVEYEDGKPIRVDTIVLSTQHLNSVEIEALRSDIKEFISEWVRTLPKEVQALFKGDMKLHINPTGRFVIGGPAGDTGLTGRKIIVDTYGGKGYHGGGAFSGKDPSKVDRSGAYYARWLAKNFVAAGVCDECSVQIAYAIGVATPVSLLLDFKGTNRSNLTEAEWVKELITHQLEPTPYNITRNCFGDLYRPIYSETAKHGHFGNPSFPWEGLELKTFLTGIMESNAIR